MCSEINSLKEHLIECLSQQLSEIDLLQAMYPNSGDIILSDKNITEVRDFIDSKSEYIPNNLDFVINLSISQLKLELFINLPLSYPNEEPDVYIRCNQLNRLQETSLNTDLSEFLKLNYVGEVCLYTAITWLQDNIDTFTLNRDNDTNTFTSALETDDTQDDFTRYWIYSHHIYNKKKREDIQKLAKESGLTGFCLPGKPGVICIEGTKGACMEWWKIVKAMCWQKITIRTIETFEPNEEISERKFNNFVELHLQNPVNNKHANMSEFSKYMSDHGFSKIFNDFFWDK